MASLWQKALWALGLTDDEEPDDSSADDPTQANVRTVDASAGGTAPAGPISIQAGTRVPGRRVEPPTASRQLISSNPRHAEAGVYVRGGAAGVTTRPAGHGVEIISAHTFSDAQLLADHIRAGTAVALDLRGAETAMVRRLVDFSSGLTYGLGGKMVKIAQGVILVTPANVAIGVEDRQRLIDLGLHTAPSEG